MAEEKVPIGQEKPMDEFEKVFDTNKINQEEEGKEKELGSIIDADKGQYKYLINVGQPSFIKINMQKSTQWFDEIGRKIRLDVVTSDPEDPEMVMKRRQFGLIIGEMQKAFIYWYDGKFTSTAKNPSVVDGGFTFRTLSYPHIFNYTCGNNKRDERIYDLPVMKVVRVDNIADAEEILEKFSFVIETDEGGNFKADSVKYLRDVNSRPLKKSEMAGVNFPQPQKVGFEEFSPHNPENKPIDLVKGVRSEIE